METSVSLQAPFSYAIWPMVFIGMPVLVFGVYLLVSAMRKGKKPVENKGVIQRRRIDCNLIKRKYLMQLERMQQDLCNGRITTRDVYQSMSLCIRGFVYEVTGIQVQNYTLEDIKKLQMPELEALISEYYAPEFAWQSVGDSHASLEKTKRAIQLWN